MANKQKLSNFLVIGLLALCAVVFSSSSAFAVFMPGTTNDNSTQAYFIETTNKAVPANPSRSISNVLPVNPSRGISADNQGKSQYVAGEVIIKLKENNNTDVLFTQSYSTRAANNYNRLSGIKSRHNLRDEKPVFKHLHDQLKTRNLSQNVLSVEHNQKFLKRKARPPKQTKEPDLFPIYRLKTDKDVQETCRNLKQDPDVEYAEPNYIMKACMVPNDPYYLSSNSWGQGYDDLWGLKRIQCEQAWDISQGEGVVVAVIDTGVDYNHTDLWDNIWVNPAVVPDRNNDGKIDLNDCDLNGDHIIEPNEIIDNMFGWDFVGVDCNNPVQDNDPMDGFGHGTHCAGTIAAVGNNNIGIIGVAPKAKIMMLKGLDDNGSGSDSNLADCIQYAIDNSADVLSCSWGGYGTSQILADAINYAHNQGCVIVAAAGNDHKDLTDMKFFPANLPDVITVSAFDQDDQRCTFSNYGTKIDVGAPGGGKALHSNILSLLAPNSYLARYYAGQYDDLGSAYIIGTDYLRIEGTSMACPHVAGVAALIRSHHPEFTNEDIRWAIKVSADDVGLPGYDLASGCGRVNAKKAVAVDSVLNLSIISPVAGAVNPNVSLIAITGTVMGPDFKQYELAYAKIQTLDSNYPDLFTTPLEWFPISSATTPVENGPLGNWDIGQLSMGVYILRLTATTYSGAQFQCAVEVYKEIALFRQITADSVYNVGPDISGDKIVYLKNFNPNYYDVYLYDLSTDTETQITDTLTFKGSPIISNNKIVWAEERNYNWDIYLYNLSTNTERQITTDPGIQICASISGDKIVWEDYRNDDGSWANPDIYLYDLSTNTERQITTDPSEQRRPRVFGDKIVWDDLRNGFYAIYLYDLSTNTERQVTANPQNQYYADISNDKIVWMDDRNLYDSNSDVYLYDLSTNIERQVTADPGVQYYPRISGNKIVWVNQSPGDDNIYLYDLSTNTETQITANLAFKDNPAISGNRIVWEDHRNGCADIYMYELPDAPPVLNPIGNKEVKEGEKLEFPVSATDPDNDPLNYSAGGLPAGATFVNQTFSWTPTYDQAGTYQVTFTVSDGSLTASETITITVNEVAVISIELNESIWKIDAIKLGDQKSNLNDAGVPIHAIKNTGTVSVAVDIGYGPMAYGLIHPGREQGLDTFVTTVETGFMLNGATLFGIIPPNDRIKVAEITPGNGFPMRLTYAAPTALSENNQGMSVTYEIRAYPVDQNK